MLNSIHHFFQMQGFMPHGACLLWQPAVLWTMVIANAIITASYFVIPFALGYFLKKRPDLKFKTMVFLFGAFILACGTTHLIDIFVFWYPMYGLQAVLLAITAVVSATTAILIWPKLPAMLKIPSPWLLELKNKELLQVNAELKNLEEQSRAILEAGPDAMIMINENGKILLANKQVEALFGYDKDNILGMDVEILMPVRFRNSHLSHRTRYFKNSQPRPMGADLDLFGLSRSGREFPVEISLSPLDLDGKRLTIATVRDVSKIRRYESQIEKAKEIEQLNRELELQHMALVRSNDELDDFSYVASHDLREPLRGIHNYAQFLLEDYGDKLDSNGKKMLHAMPVLTEKLDQLIDSLLEYSRVGRVELAYQKCQIREIVDDVLASVAPTLDEKHVEVIRSDNLPEIYCDAVRIREVFRNFIVNALKYNDKEHPIIEIGYDEEKEAFYIKDNGIGIEDRHHQNIFKIFRRLHDRNAYEGGTGAGLTITKKIIDRHGGKIWLESTVGEGTCFYFTLSGRSYESVRFESSQPAYN